MFILYFESFLFLWSRVVLLLSIPDNMFIQKEWFVKMVDCEVYVRVLNCTVLYRYDYHLSMAFPKFFKRTTSYILHYLEKMVQYQPLTLLFVVVWYTYPPRIGNQTYVLWCIFLFYCVNSLGSRGKAMVLYFGQHSLVVGSCARFTVRRILLYWTAHSYTSCLAGTHSFLFLHEKLSGHEWSVGCRQWCLISEFNTIDTDDS